MPNENDSPTNEGNPEQHENNPQHKNISDGIRAKPKNDNPQQNEGEPAYHRKPPLSIRVWRSLWRRRIFWHHVPRRPAASWAEIITICVTVAIVIVGGCQLFVYWEQEQIMGDALKQTGAQLAITNRSSKISSDALDENRRQFQETLKQMKEQTRSQVAAVATSKDANALARQAMEAQTRPWIGIDGIPTVPTPTNTSERPESLDEVRLQNFGLSPAFYVTVKFRAVFPRDSFRPTFPEMKDVCSAADSGMDEALARVDSPIPIITVFPGKDAEQSVKGVHFGHINKLPGTYLIGCIAYKDAMSFRHHTWVV
jgi:hypothetical protein